MNMTGAETASVSTAQMKGKEDARTHINVSQKPKSFDLTLINWASEPQQQTEKTQFRFNPDSTLTSLKDGFRVMTGGKPHPHTPPHRPPPHPTSH
ncbi:hypothetical protein M422DRAFT_264534 [Sphaerobolus stellatus SS14]|uniref:Unplaced genomic scaffold SPHSTscaffold_137, whole genome shotgun sequence n=1 Tax=Sphaerobolus stellatus (strain SS14) TaxID=990650 RepID=A0A0C9V7R2_SPHS4|nr:hypothetical protein M422DRAFT_264534 [Sphaerobolus stellatus SS14]